MRTLTSKQFWQQGKQRETCPQISSVIYYVKKIQEVIETKYNIIIYV